MLKKQDILEMANKGEQTYDKLHFTVTIIPPSGGGELEMLVVKQHLSPNATIRVGGLWTKFVDDEYVAALVIKMRSIADRWENVPHCYGKKEDEKLCE